MVRPYRTFSVYIVTGETRSAGFLCTSSGCFKHIEPRRTFPKHIVTEIAKCVNFCHMSTGWFDHTEPSRSTSLQGKQGVQGVVHLFGVVQAHRTSSNLPETHHFKDSKVCRVLYHEFGVVRCTSSGWFKHIEPRRTFPNHIITEIVRCVEFCHMSSGWFDCTEPSLSTSLQGKQGVQGAYALVRGCSSTSNLVEPSRTTSLQR